MPDDRRPTPFSGLIRHTPDAPKPDAAPAPEPTPEPAQPRGFQIQLADLGGEFNAIARAVATASAETFEEILMEVGPRVEPMMAASAHAIAERVGLLAGMTTVTVSGQFLAEIFSAFALRMEILRWGTVCSLDAVALCPAAAQARAEEDAKAEAEGDDNDE